MTLTFAAPETAAIPIRLIDPANWDDTHAALTAFQQGIADLHAFQGGLAQVCLLPDPDTAGAVACVLIGTGTLRDRARKRFAIGAAISALPTGTYAVAECPDDIDLSEVGLGHLLARYRFTRYRAQALPGARLVAPDGISAPQLEAFAAGEALTRDLINTPTNDMGPGDLAEAVRKLAETHKARLTVIEGAALLQEKLPLIHAVGRASDRAPRLIDLEWGDTGSSLTLVGKGVCFDTGGLNLKPGASMALMKKDMGGAATVLGLAHMIMALDLPLRLRVLIPAVENAVAGNAFRPGDILTARNGKTVEINNTDAEGRLVLADALALANETPADMTLCMATLTGAARVAVGPDIAPFYTDDDALADSVATGARDWADPVWRMPFHDPYDALIDPGIADLDNAPKGGFAGSITAALFLRNFVPDCPRFAHFDIYGWQPADAPARPKGGAGQGARAIIGAIMTELLP
jgi:leucyl aminopeptidase